MIHIGVAEDEEDFLQQTITYLNRISEESGQPIRIDVFQNGQTLVEKYVSPETYDILLLDIEMPQMNGMEAARRIRNIDDTVVIVFLTHLSGLAINGYEVGALDFIVKPISYPVFSMKMRRILKRIEKKQEKYILVSAAGMTRKIAISDICYAEIISHRLHIHTLTEEFVINKTMTDFEKEINDRTFARCNSGIIVNLRYVTELNAKMARVAGNILPVSRSRYKGFLKELTEYVGRMC